ncbi:uncharacterized protein LOC129773392 [Toxorhynchites rutilus septentrionalis]|uniref:uncharacterized protein LOC129773392 n=1 Tax=Toxorhynchites rutilus septentrionalis TaxID=329112 RepID=UPI00247AB27B|nr:uncharacterized protein LOC129773392 [Toxorhynchites rutilus septentrionalis]
MTLRKSAQHLKSLLRKRENILGSARLIEQFNADYDASKANQLQIRIERLNQLWDKFEDTEDEIEAFEDQEEGFSEIRQEFQNLYFELKSSLVSKIPIPARAPSSPPAAHSSTFCVPPANHLVSVKLPEIKIPEFGGKSDEWFEFRDLFKSLVHTNSQISAVQKLHYLRSALKGEASRLISSLTITSDNYSIAWKTISDRYENKNFLVKQHMSAILKIPHVRKDSAFGLAELADEFNRHFGILDKLESAEAHWNSFLVERLSNLLDEKSLLDWESQCEENQVPQYQNLLNFIHKRSRTLQMCKSTHSQLTTNPTKPVKIKSSTHVASENIIKCPNCKQTHALSQCELFLKLKPNSRLDFVKKHQLCINCLRGGHMARDCRSSLCRTCTKKHHSLLHLPPIASVPAVIEEEESALSTCTAVCSTESFVHPVNTSYSVSFAPSVVPSRNSPQPYGSSVGSSLSKSSAVGNPSLSSSINSVHRSESEPLSCPQASTHRKSYEMRGSQSNFVSESLCQKLGLKRNRINLPKTVLGYVVCGKYSTPSVGTVACHVVTEQDLNSQLERMWEVENLDVGKSFTREEQDVKDYFLRTVNRDVAGRYTVRLPFRESIVPLLGDSYEPALRRFVQMEKRFVRDRTLYDEYVKFMDEYERLGHMEVSSVEGPQYFLPHHAVHRPESSTTKIRIVFDASRKGSGSLSLNEVLHAGPTVQPPLLSTILNFRMYQYVFTADAEKMFRQIWVDPEDRKFQQIIWRRDPSLPLEIYRLKTVTYGLAVPSC